MINLVIQPFKHNLLLPGSGTLYYLAVGQIHCRHEIGINNPFYQWQNWLTNSKIEKEDVGPVNLIEPTGIK